MLSFTWRGTARVLQLSASRSRAGANNTSQAGNARQMISKFASPPSLFHRLVIRQIGPASTLHHSKRSYCGKTDTSSTKQKSGDGVKDYVEEAEFDLETLRKNDQSRLVDVHTEKVDPNDPMWKKSRYKGFPRAEMDPGDLSKYANLEKEATEYMEKATTATDVNVVREYAQSARDKFEQYLTATGNYGATPDVLFHLGISCIMLRDWMGAIETLLEALDLDPKLLPATRHIGDAFQASKKHVEAIHFYDRFYNGFKEYYGRLSDETGHMTTETGQKVKLDGDSMLSDVIFNRGRSYFALGEYGNIAAKEDFKIVVRLDGLHKANALYFLGLSEFQAKDYWKSIKYLDLALKTGPATWFMYKARSDSYRALGKDSRADDDERQAHILKRQLHWQHQAINDSSDPLPEVDFEKTYLKRR